MENEKLAPCPSSLGVAQSLPRWLSTMERLMAKPMPMPVVLVVWNGSNSFSMSSAFSPTPAS
jgi:hypothetical protein